LLVIEIYLADLIAHLYFIFLLRNTILSNRYGIQRDLQS